MKECGKSGARCKNWTKGALYLPLCGIAQIYGDGELFYYLCEL